MVYSFLLKWTLKLQWTELEVIYVYKCIIPWSYARRLLASWWLYCWTFYCQLQEFVNRITYFMSILLDSLVYFQLQKLGNYILYFIGLISKTFVCAGVCKLWSVTVCIQLTKYWILQYYKNFPIILESYTALAAV